MSVSNNTRHPQTLKSQFRQAVRNTTIAASLAATLLSGGCTRQNYRCKTDTEAYYLLDEKVQQSCEQVSAPYRIELDSRSRMFDPFNPDRQPMPEDDPQANCLMRRVDGKKGYPLWEANGRTNIVENPQWWEFLPLDERGVLVLDLNESVRTALLHSTSYQNSKEELYLSALDVSSERFLLDSQFFAGWQNTYNTVGPARTGESSSTFTTGPFSRGRRPFSMQKRFATGADLIVGFANSLTWQFAGPNDQSASSILDFSLIQPLLRQGGRDVVLERLTLAERTLLANVRAFERYRRAFYVDVATGRGSDNQAPRRRGGVFGGSGFSGFSGLGGGFGNLGGGGGGGGFAGGGATPGAGGFLGLLQDQLNIANQQENILQLEDIYLQFQDNYRELLMKMPADQTALPSDLLQVAQARQSLFNSQTQLLSFQSNYQASLDSFKSTLGLPPYLCVEIKDPMLDQFKLISQELRDRRADVQLFRRELGNANSELLALSDTETDPTTGNAYRIVDATPELEAELMRLDNELQPLTQILETLRDQDLPVVAADIEKLEESIPIRRKQLARLKEIALQEKDMVCSLLPLGDFNTTFLDGEGLDELPGELREELERLATQLDTHVESYETLLASIARISSDLPNYDSARERFTDISEEVILGSQDLVAAVNETVQAVQIVQARARTESVLLPEIDLSPRDAVETARNNRRDWLNNRASLVNTWRAIEVVADDLESYLDLTITGDVINVGDNPLNLRGSTGRLRAGLQWDAPITRLQERNNYRQILIEYQRAKRSYYQYEDSVWTTMRAALRQIRQNQLSFEIQRYAVQNAALQNSVNADIRRINESLGLPSGPDAARNANSGLQDFLATQGTLIGVYVNFEALRRSLDLDLGTMEIDAEGLWIDPGPLRADTIGANLGEAILDYGLSEGEMLLRDEIQVVEDQPLETAPSNQMPVMPDDTLSPPPAVGQPVPPPVPMPGLNNGAAKGNAPGRIASSAYYRAGTTALPEPTQPAFGAQSAAQRSPDSLLPGPRDALPANSSARSVLPTANIFRQRALVGQSVAIQTASNVRTIPNSQVQVAQSSTNSLRQPNVANPAISAASATTVTAETQRIEPPAGESPSKPKARPARRRSLLEGIEVSTNRSVIPFESLDLPQVPQ